MPGKKYSIQSKYEYVAALNKAVRSFLMENLVSPWICNDLEICLTEALNNVIKHAYKEQNDKQIEIIVLLKKSYLIVRISDEGIPRPNRDKPKLEYNPNDIENLPEGGMGLFIIDKLMDDTDYKEDDGKNIFIMKKNLS